MTLRNLPLPGAELLFAPAFLPAAEATALLAHLTAEAAWEQRTIRLFGREFPQPRLTAWYGDPAARYTYSGLTWEPRPWLPALADLRQRLEAATRTRYNSVLLNLYRDGRDSMGTVRRFRLRPRAALVHPPFGIDLPHGSLLLMRGPTQEHWQHALPKTARPVGPRLNLTFRWVGPAAPG